MTDSASGVPIKLIKKGGDIKGRVCWGGGGLSMRSVSHPGPTIIYSRIFQIAIMEICDRQYNVIYYRLK